MQFSRKLFRFLFYSHLILIAILTIFLTIRGVNKHHFHPKKWYPPLLTSTAAAGVVSFTFQGISPSKPIIKTIFWVTPLLICAVGILFLLIDSVMSTALGVFAIVSAFILSIYTCWVNPRFEYAATVLSLSTSVPPGKTAAILVSFSIIISIVYSCFLVSGIGGATATGRRLDIMFIVIILLSLALTMQVIKNVLQVTISRVKYMHFAHGVDMDTRLAFRDTIKYLMGSVCIGSVLVPVLGVIRGSARVISLVAGDRDEFLFSFADCYSRVALNLGMHGNRWGFVHVGVCNKGFVQASVDTWEMFGKIGMEPLIDSDLTGAFCFLCGVTGGSVSALVGGTWAFVVHKSYATEVSIYAFLIGYFMCRIAMAWPQACVSAYYVAYAEYPQSPGFDSTIPARIQRLRIYQER